MSAKDSKYSTITIKRELYHDLKNYSNKHGYNMSKLVSIMIENKIKETL